MISKAEKVLRTILLFAAISAIGLVLTMLIVLRLDKPLNKPAPIAPAALVFLVCGKPGGVLLVQPDGSTSWYIEPYHGLEEQLVHVDQSNRKILNLCRK